MVKKMKREDLKIKESSHFIGSWIVDAAPLDEIINYFNLSNSDHDVGKTEKGLIDKEKKDCIELSITPKKVKEAKLDFFIKYFNILRDCYDDYKSQWELFESNWNQIHIGAFFIEKFLVSGHHLDFHYDRKNIYSSHKSLSWITFLNNVKKDEGELVFKYFDHSIKPKKGLTLIFPSDWMYMHKQNILKTQDKFILKGNIKFTELE